MQNIIIALKLFILGLYIEFMRTILNLIIKYKKSPLSSPKIILFSKLCNYATTKFLFIEKNYAKISEKI